MDHLHVVVTQLTMPVEALEKTVAMMDPEPTLGVPQSTMPGYEDLPEAVAV